MHRSKQGKRRTEVRKSHKDLENEDGYNIKIIGGTATVTTTQNQNLAMVISKALPALSGSAVSYNSAHDIYLSQGYTSSAGNTYFQGIRLSEKLIVMYDFGQGWAHLFLNAIRLFCFDGKEKKLITSSSYNNFWYNEHDARRECVRLLGNYLKSHAKMLGVNVAQAEIEEVSTAMIEATNHNNL